MSSRSLLAPLLYVCASGAQRQGWLLGTTRMGDTTTDSRPGLSQFTERPPWARQAGAPTLAQRGRGVSWPPAAHQDSLAAPHHLGDPVTGGEGPRSPNRPAHSMPSPHTEHLARDGPQVTRLCSPHHRWGTAELDPHLRARPPPTQGTELGAWGPLCCPSFPRSRRGNNKVPADSKSALPRPVAPTLQGPPLSQGWDPEAAVWSVTMGAKGTEPSSHQP